MAWTIEDRTNGRSAGYLRILCDGVRAADVFPYAKGADEKDARDRAQYMVEVLNARSALSDAPVK